MNVFCHSTSLKGKHLHYNSSCDAGKANLWDLCNVCVITASDFEG
jgi:hypothetical protein